MAVASVGLPRSLRVASAASSVASVPNNTSNHGAPPSRLASRQPTASPGTASAASMGITVSASEKRN